MNPLVGVHALWLVGCAPFPMPAHVVDLTHTLSPAFPYVPIRDVTFPIRIVEIGNLDRDGVYSNKWELTEHNGTHLIDTLSIDHGPDSLFSVHRLLFAADKWALECLTRLGDLPPTGATLIVGVAKVARASGAPARVFAVW